MISCSKSPDPENFPQSSIAYVSVVHAAPKAGSLDFAFDNNSPGLNFFNFANRTNYLNVFEGLRKFSVFAKGTSDTLIAKNIMPQAQKNYTIFIVNDVSKMDAIFVIDSSRTPGTDSVRIRFANMSPDLGNMDLYVEGGTIPIATNVSFKTVTDFVSWKAANDVAFEVRQAGQNTVIAKLAIKQNLLVGNYYTVWASGFKSAGTEVEMPSVNIFRH
jgi:hypothetical protein